MDELENPRIPAKTGNPFPPPGFGQTSTKTKTAEVKRPTTDQVEQLKIKKAWEIATGPAKSIPMNLIMSYMTGNSLQMIPIMMTLMLFWNPLKAIFTETNSSFEALVTEKNRTELYLPKAVFVLCQMATMAIGVWKLNSMGLIPNGEADWLAWKDVTQVVERLTK